MLIGEDVIKILRSQFPYLNTEYGVKRIGIFGPLTKGQADEESDVDIVAEFERPIGLRFIEFTEYLEQLFGRKTDVFTPAGIRGIRNKSISIKIIK